MPIHHPIPGVPPLKWDCEAQIETQDIDDVASDYSQGPFPAFVLFRAGSDLPLQIPSMTPFAFHLTFSPS